MPMDRYNLRHLRAFWQVVACGSVSAASEKVYLSQPAITQALAKLEASLGSRLFVRKSNGMFPKLRLKLSFGSMYFKLLKTRD